MTSSVRFPTPVRALTSALTVVAGLVLFAMALLTVADVFSRNLRGQSILGAVEISALLLVAVAFLGLAAAEIDGQHVSVSLIDDRLGRRGRMATSLVRAVLLTGLGAALVVAMFEVLGSALDRGETTNDILRLPTWPAKLIILLSFSLFFVLAVWRQILFFRAARAGEDVPTDNEVFVGGDEPTDSEGDRVH